VLGLRFGEFLGHRGFDGGVGEAGEAIAPQHQGGVEPHPDESIVGEGLQQGVIVCDDVAALRGWALRAEVDVHYHCTCGVR